LEIGEQAGDDLALAAHRPERQRRRSRRLAARRRDRRDRRQARRAGHGTASQPPVNPARTSARRRYALPRITFQISPLRWFSIIPTIGPWSMPSASTSTQPAPGTTWPVAGAADAGKPGLNASTKPSSP